MRDLTANYALLAGMLFFVGRLQVFPSLGDAFIAGLLASVTVAVVLVAYDTFVQRAPEVDAASPAPPPVTSESLPHPRREA